jgi:uncharacterized protein YraI
VAARVPCFRAKPIRLRQPYAPQPVARLELPDVGQRSFLQMTLTADQYLDIAQGYAKAAADPFVSPEGREAFANKAEWFDFLGRRERGALRSDGNASTNNRDATARPFAGEFNYSEQPRRSMRPLVTTLGLTGAVLYLIGTLLFTNAFNLFGEKDREEVASELTPPLVSSPKIASVDAKATEQGERQFQPTADRPISPGQAPSYEALMVPPSLMQQEELGSPSPPPEPIEELAAAQPAEVLKVTVNATIREGPSTSAKKIGTAVHGAALHVKAREGDWVQFVDPASGNTGWIHSSLVRPNSGSGTTSVAAPPADARSLAPPKPKVAKKRIKQKPSAPIQASKQRPSRPGPPAPGRRAYADLPDDEVFLPPRRPGPGFLTKRRMLREGVMSPGFLPPQ